MKFLAHLLIVFSFGCMAQQEKLTGRDVRIFEDTPNKEVALAIRDGKLDVARRLLHDKPKSTIDFREPYFGQSLLNWAVYRDNLEAAKLLLEFGADPNLKAYDSTTAVINAADKSDTSEFLKMTLAYGGDPNSVANIDQPQRLRTPLVAAAGNRLESVKLLIKAGADPEYIHRMNIGKTSESIQSALISACKTDAIEIVRYLLIEVGVAFDYYFYTTIEGKKLGILYALRMMVFDIGSTEHRIKMEVVSFLRTKGLDYQKEPIPEQFLNLYERSFLEKY